MRVAFGGRRTVVAVVSGGPDRQEVGAANDAVDRCGDRRRNGRSARLRARRAPPSTTRRPDTPDSGASRAPARRRGSQRSRTPPFRRARRDRARAKTTASALPGAMPAALGSPAPEPAMVPATWRRMIRRVRLRRERADASKRSRCVSRAAPSSHAATRTPAPVSSYPVLPPGRIAPTRASRATSSFSATMECANALGPEPCSVLGSSGVQAVQAVTRTASPKVRTDRTYLRNGARLGTRGS